MNDFNHYLNFQSICYVPINSIPVNTLVFNVKGDLELINKQASSFLGIKDVLEYNHNKRLYNKNAVMFRKLIAELREEGRILDRLLIFKLIGTSKSQIFIKCSATKMEGNPDLYVFMFVEVSVFQAMMDKRMRNQKAGKILPDHFVTSDTLDLPSELPEEMLSTITDNFPTLSLNEAICFGLVAMGLSNSQISEKLNRTVNSVTITVFRVVKKLNLRSKRDILLNYRALLFESVE